MKTQGWGDWLIECSPQAVRRAVRGKLGCVIMNRWTGILFFETRGRRESKCTGGHLMLGGGPEAEGDKLGRINEVGGRGIR